MSSTQNAGVPPDSVDANTEEQKRILATLCSDAPNDEVRNCLRKYSLDKSAWQLETAFKQVRKPVLVETLAYLGVPNMDEFKAEALPNEITCRIQNLLPDHCPLCENNYCIRGQRNP